MKGSRRERSKGVHELRVYVGRDPVTGKKRWRSETFRGPATKADARLRALCDEIEAERTAAPPSALDEMTVRELLERWLRLGEADWAPKTAHDHAHTVRSWIAPRLGDRLVVELRRAAIEEFYAELARNGGRGGAPLSPASVRKVHTVLHAALEEAIRLDLIAGNPSHRARRPKVTKYRATVPTLEQVTAVIAAADQELATLIRLAVATGARRGELVALRWGDVSIDDEDLERLRIHRSITQIGKRWEEKDTKTAADAELAIDAGTAQVLRAWRTTRREQSLALGRGRLGPRDWLFPHWRNHDEPMRPDRAWRLWRAHADAHGLEGVRLHDLRHAAATHMVAAGIDVRTVAARLRHASPAMTLDVYAGRDLAADRAAATLMGRLYSS